MPGLSLSNHHCSSIFGNPSISSPLIYKALFSPGLYLSKSFSHTEPPCPLHHRGESHDLKQLLELSPCLSQLGVNRERSALWYSRLSLCLWCQNSIWTAVIPNLCEPQVSFGISEWSSYAAVTGLSTSHLGTHFGLTDEKTSHLAMLVQLLNNGSWTGAQAICFGDPDAGTRVWRCCLGHAHPVPKCLGPSPGSTSHSNLWLMGTLGGSR